MKIKNSVAVALMLFVTSSVLPCRMLGLIALPEHSLSTLESNGNFHPYLEAELEEFRLQGGSGSWPYSNQDGWAMTSFASSSGNIEVQCVRSEVEAFQDDGYYELASQLLSEESVSILMGHLRQTSSGAGGIANPHPFIYTNSQGQHFSFAHNGDLNKAELRELIGDEWLGSHPPQTFGGGPWNAEGWSQVVDSELFFFWIMKSVEASGSLLEGITEAMLTLENEQPYNLKNFLLSDGQDLYAYRSSTVADIHYFDGSNEEELPWYLMNSNHRAIMSTPPSSGPLSSIPWVELEDRQLLILKADGSSELHPPLLEIDSDDQVDAPRESQLNKAYPNPFNGSTIIPIMVVKEGVYSLIIYNANGQQVFNTTPSVFHSGRTEFSWSGQDNYGNPLPSGSYIFLINGNQHIASGKLLFLK